MAHDGEKAEPRVGTGPRPFRGDHPGRTSGGGPVILHGYLGGCPARRSGARQCDPSGSVSARPASRRAGVRARRGGRPVRAGAGLGRRLRARAGAFVVSSLVALLPAVAAAQFAIMPPPTTGPYAYYPPYGTFGPDQPGFLAVGQSYVDPVFGSTIRRLSNAYPGSGDALLYARNGLWK